MMHRRVPRVAVIALGLLVLALLAPSPAEAMQKYVGWVISKSGQALSGVSVTVTVVSTGATATIYSDNGITSQVNPFLSAADGSYTFYAANGRYNITFSLSGYTFDATDTADVLLFDPLGVCTANALAKFSTATLLGCSLLADDGTALTLASGRLVLPNGATGSGSLRFAGSGVGGLYYDTVNNAVRVTFAGPVDSLLINASQVIALVPLDLYGGGVSGVRLQSPLANVFTLSTNGVEALRADSSAAILLPSLTVTGSAGGKKVVCVDTTTGKLYASSNGTDCSN